MKTRRNSVSPLPKHGIRVALSAVMLLASFVPTALAGQERGARASEAYFRAVSEYFHVSPAEMVASSER